MVEDVLAVFLDTKIIILSQVLKDASQNTEQRQMSSKAAQNSARAYPASTFFN